MSEWTNKKNTKTFKFSKSVLSGALQCDNR